MSKHDPGAVSIDRYRRHFVLAGWGIEGQQRVKDAKVLVVGCGGLGAPVVQYLAAAGVGHLTLVDDDRVQTSNLNRQILFGAEDVEQPKVVLAQKAALRLNPALGVDARLERLATHNARAWVAEHDLVIDCTDGLPNKYLLNDACVLERVPLVHGAVSGWSGQLLCVEPGASGCLRCVFPDVPDPAAMPTCQSIGVLGASCGVVGARMAMWGLKRLVGLEWPSGRLWALDLSADRDQVINVTKNDRCPVCGTEADIDGRNPSDYSHA